MLKLPNQRSEQSQPGEGLPVPLQIQTRDFELSPILEESIRKKVAHLQRFHPHLTSFRLTIQGPGGHHHKGGQYDVCIDITMPGAEIVVSRQPSEDLAVSIREAFVASRRQLEDYVRRRRGFTKAHEDWAALPEASNAPEAGGGGE